MALTVTEAETSERLSASGMITVTVTNVNRAPSLAVPSSPVPGQEGTELTFTASATDLDELARTSLRYSTTELPAGASLHPTTGAFAWTPSYTQAGDYPITITVTDQDPAAPLTDTKPLTLSVANVNRAPSLTVPTVAPLVERAATEPATSLQLVGADDDGDPLTYSATGLPAWASLNAQTGELILTPGYEVVTPAEGQKTFAVQVTVSDGQASSAPQTLTLTVQHVNQPPSATLSPAGPQTVNENQLLVVKVQGADADGDALTFQATGLPTGALFVPLGDVNLSGQVTGTDATYISYYLAGKISLDARQKAVADVNGQDGITILDASLISYYLAGNLTGLPPFWDARVFVWTPGYDQAGSYSVTVTVTDGTATTSETVPVTVVNVNRAPTLTAIGAKTVIEGTLLTFSVTGSDPDGDTASYSATGLPVGATFTSATFAWTPTMAQAGSHSVTFTVTDQDPQQPLSASETVTITVKDVLTPWQTGAPSRCQSSSPSSSPCVSMNISWSYAMGYHFTPQVGGQITHLGGRFNGTKSVRLFDQSTTPPTLLAQTTVAGDNTWKYAPIPPVAVSPTKTYTVAVYLGGSGGSYQYNLSPTLVSAPTFGNLRLLGSTYVYYTGSDANVVPPLTTSNPYTMYGQADVGFVPGP